MDATDRVLGCDRLTSVFGYWPTFHDAEVVWLRLDRRPSGEGYGPTVEAMIHAFEMTSEVGSDGCYVLRNHVLVHFCFRDVVELRLDGFNHQNALSGLVIADLRERQWEHIHFQVSLDPAFGVGASFQCHEVEVVSVTPCDREGAAVADA
ncbi:Imm50 family immunity protein [Tautonia marina]|uniref:Imm50 family immunity protein n=1 Tax=Tautonia marina TaxID=2653855 RepID=UPI00126057E3|nr:Imm50 family immunity protein [Tautonia marina]